MELGADEREPAPFGMVGLRVGDGGVLLHDLLVPDLRIAPTGLGPAGLLRRSEHAGRRSERVELERRPLSLVDAIVETDEGPPFPVHEHGERGDRADLLLRELDPFLLGERIDDPVHGRTRRHQIDPSGEPCVGERGAPEGGVLELRRHTRRAPLGELSGPIPGVRRVDLDQVGPADAGGHAQVHQYVVDRIPPVRRQEQPFGRVGDGGEHAVAREQRFFMSDRSSHAILRRSGRVRPVQGLVGLSGAPRVAWSPLLGAWMSAVRGAQAWSGRTGLVSDDGRTPGVEPAAATSPGAGQRARDLAASLNISSTAFGSSAPGRCSMTPSAVARSQMSWPRSVRTIERVHPSDCPRPPKEMSACSAAKSGQCRQPGLVYCWASFSE